MIDQRVLFTKTLIKAMDEERNSGLFEPTVIRVTQERNCHLIWLETPNFHYLMGWHSNKSRAIEEAVSLASMSVTELIKAAEGIISAMAVANNGEAYA